MAPLTRSESVLTALRSATVEARDELVKKLALRDISRDRYDRFLRASMSVVAPLEARIACWLGVPSDGFYRTAALRSDLRALGVEDTTPASVPSISSLAEAMGAAYVLEASALDGVRHAESIARRFGADVPRRFLSLRGAQTAERWYEFVTSLEQWGAHAPAHGRVMACESARMTFAAYASAFAAGGVFGP